MIDFAELLADRGPLIGTFVKLPVPESVELMALAGLDFVILDLEHSAMTLETASTLIAVAQGRGLCSFVRVPEQAQSWIQRSLDAGASGVLVPHVDTAGQAQAVGRAARFEPVGTRGMGPTTRAGRWGMAPGKEYMASADRVSVVAQIESDAGVEAVPEILAQGHVDALFVGPADLSVSLGRPADHPDVTSRVQRVSDACRDAGRPCGTATGADPAGAAALIANGHSFVTLSNDATILGSGAAHLVRDLRAVRR